MNQLVRVLSWIRNLSTVGVKVQHNKYSYKKHSRGRFLQIESLENRELLSVTPLGNSHVSCQNDHQESDAPYYCALPPVESAAPQEETASIFPQVPLDLSQTFNLHSNSEATLKIYLDFDGHVTTNSYWNNYSRPVITTPAYNFEGNALSFTDNELTRIQYIWQRVAEDYAIFNVDVTTEDPGLDGLRKTSATDTEYGARCVIGGSSADWYGTSAGGVSYINIFGGASSSSYNSPCFVFPAQLSNGAEKYVAEAASHEVGHFLGLGHDGQNPGDGEYYQGAGGWAPIMGTAYYQSLSQWSKGEYDHATLKQDDLGILSQKMGYRSDDYGNTITDAAILSTENLTLDAAGIIEQNTDTDFFQFALDVAQTFNLNIKSGGRDANLDILAHLYDSTGSVIATSNSINTLDASFNLELEAGTYYISIEGTGKVLADGTVVYTDYGSLGTYSLFADIVVPVPQPPMMPEITSIGRYNAYLTVSWKKQYDLTGYELSYRKEGTDTWTTKMIPGNAVLVIMSGLTEDTMYEIRLTAKNADGEATSTTSASTLRTLVPPKVPTNFRSTAQTDNSITLAWSGQSNLTGYELSYRPSGTTTWTSTDLPANAVTTIVSGLTSDREYEFRLTAKNADGTKNVTTSASTLRTLVPPMMPEITSIGRYNAYLTVSWKKQYDLTGYELSYRKEGTDTWTTKMIPGNAVLVIMSGLTEDTMYEIRLTAKNADGEATSIVSAKTLSKK